MSDLWDEEGFGGSASGNGEDDDWDDGDEGAAVEIEDGFDDPEGEAEDEGWDDDAEE